MAKKKAAAKKGKACGEPVIVASKVKAYVKSKGMMSSKDFLGCLSGVVCEAIDKAVVRAQGNKRSTLQPRDL
jgi:hypothetical protein